MCCQELCWRPICWVEVVVSLLGWEFGNPLYVWAGWCLGFLSFTGKNCQFIGKDSSCPCKIRDKRKTRWSKIMDFFFLHYIGGVEGRQQKASSYWLLALVYTSRNCEKRQKKQSVVSPIWLASQLRNSTVLKWYMLKHCDSGPGGKHASLAQVKGNEQLFFLGSRAWEQPGNELEDFSLKRLIPVML